MEKYSCKLCFRNFANGKALGGHMRSHMMSLYAAQKEKEVLVQPFENDCDFQSSSSTSEEEDENREKEASCYGLRENPKKNIRVFDPGFFLAPGSVVLQDRESETEYPVFRRSKRIRKSRISVKEMEVVKKPQCERGEKSSCSDQPLSSVSDTPDEDVAYCLMMLSRDTWQREEKFEFDEEEEVRESKKYVEDDFSDDYEDSGVVKLVKSTTKVRGRYRCETCQKIFRSYQALGGHRANHKKIKLNITTKGTPREVVVETGGPAAAAVEEKIHECPICFRVFSSGQALGGHKRSHFINGGAISEANVSSTAKPFSRNLLAETLNIDLNLPAPVDDDEISQIVNSPISNGEFALPIRQ